MRMILACCIAAALAALAPTPAAAGAPDADAQKRAIAQIRTALQARDVAALEQLGNDPRVRSDAGLNWFLTTAEYRVAPRRYRNAFVRNFPASTSQLYAYRRLGTSPEALLNALAAIAATGDAPAIHRLLRLNANAGGAALETVGAGIARVAVSSPDRLLDGMLALPEAAGPLIAGERAIWCNGDAVAAVASRGKSRPDAGTALAAIRRTAARCSVTR